jgi:hypothetical protein
MGQLSHMQIRLVLELVQLVGRGAIKSPIAIDSSFQSNSHSCFLESHSRQTLIAIETAPVGIRMDPCIIYPPFQFATGIN